MITITPIELPTLIAEGKPIELVDVRSTKEFEEIHIPGARSAPLGKLSATKVVRDRKLAATEEVPHDPALVVEIKFPGFSDLAVARRKGEVFDFPELPQHVDLFRS